MKYVLISLLLVIVSLTGIHKALYKYLDYFFSPLQFGLTITALNIKDFSSFYTNLHNVRRENIKLLEDTVILESRIVELKRLEEENLLLRTQLGLQSGTLKDKPMVMANVMGNPQDITNSTVIVDRGIKDGVKVGDNVIVGDYIIGKVKEVSSVKATVELITSPDVSITTYNIDSTQKNEGITIGKHGSSVSVEKILPSERLKIGDMFVTSGKDGMFLPGLYVGKVTEVYEDPSQPLKSAALKTVLDTKRIDRVFILIEK